MNNDNKPDIIVCSQGTSLFTIYLNTGDGTFYNQTSYPAGSVAISGGVSDFNADTKPDVVILDLGVQGIRIFEQC